MGEGVVLVEFERFVQVGQRLIEAPIKVQHPAYDGADKWRCRGQLQNAHHRLTPLLRATRRLQEPTIILPSRCAA